MKTKMIVLIVVNTIFTVCYGQVSQDYKKMMCLNSNFVEGKVLFKSGIAQSASLNYEADNATIAYQQDGEILIITNPQDIDTVYIEEKKFVPVHEKFYEVIASTNSASLFALYTCKKRLIEATVDHNGMSKKSSVQVSNNLSGAYINRRFQPEYEIEFHKYFLLRLLGQNTIIKANTAKAFIKVFPSKEAAIVQYSKVNKINFEDESDILKLLDLCKY